MLWGALSHLSAERLSRLCSSQPSVTVNAQCSKSSLDTITQLQLLPREVVDGCVRAGAGKTALILLHPQSPLTF